MKVEWEWKTGSKLAGVLALLIGLSAIHDKFELESKYAGYINGTSDIIMVEYDSGLPWEEKSFYIVPTLADTPEWHSLEIKLVVLTMLLPWIVPVPKQPIRIEALG